MLKLVTYFCMNHNKINALHIAILYFQSVKFHLMCTAHIVHTNLLYNSVITNKNHCNNIIKDQSTCPLGYTKYGQALQLGVTRRKILISII